MQIFKPNLKANYLSTRSESVPRFPEKILRKSTLNKLNESKESKEETNKIFNSCVELNNQIHDLGDRFILTSNRFITNKNVNKMEDVYIASTQKKKATRHSIIKHKIQKLNNMEAKDHIPFLKYYINLEKTPGKVGNIQIGDRKD